MNKKIALLLAAAVLLPACSGKKQQDNGDGLTGQLQLSGAFALYPMAVKWSEEFQKLHPGVHIDISGGGAGKGMTDALANVVDIGMVSREVYPEEIAKGAYPFAVVKDAVLPVVNATNPDIDDIRRIGLKKSIAIGLWDEKYSTWGEVLGTASKTPVHVFTRSDACGAAETFAAWFDKKQDGLRATAIFGDPGIAEAVQKDKVGIGYNNIAYAYDQTTQQPLVGIAIIPIDVNENGQIDPEEDFYSTTPSLLEAINDGRYPSPPARDLYLVTNGKPTKPELIAFLEYVLSAEGQKWAGETRYIRLSEEKLNAGLEKLK
jgi:phosphate transport system substrate-binding protein